MAKMDRRIFISGLGAAVTLAMSQSCGELMLADLDTIKSAPAAAPKA